MGRSFDDMMEAAADAIPAPSLIPSGQWTLKGSVAIAKNAEDADNPTKGKVSFGYKPLTPGEDVVDHDAVARGEWKGETVWFDILIEKESDFQKVVNHVAKHGINTEGLDVKGAVDAFKKVKPQVMATIGSRTWTDKNSGELRSGNTLKQFLPVA